MPCEWGDDRRARPQDQLARPQIRDRHERFRRLGGNRDRLWPALQDGRTADQAQAPNKHTDQETAGELIHRAAPFSAWAGPGERRLASGCWVITSFQENPM